MSRSPDVDSSEDRDAIVDEQIAYYCERAPEYDDWFLRNGRYDRGPEANSRWAAEVERLRRELDAFAPTGNLLELACGTGIWTERLATHADKITAVDAAKLFKLGKRTQFIKHMTNNNYHPEIR